MQGPNEKRNWSPCKNQLIKTKGFKAPVARPVQVERGLGVCGAGGVRAAGRSGPLAGGQPSLKGTGPLLSCIHQLTRLTIWDLRVCGSQLLLGLGLGTALQMG